MKKPAPSTDSGAVNSAVLGKGVAGGLRAASRSVNDLEDQTQRHKQTAIVFGAATGVGHGRRALRSGKRAVSARERASGFQCGSQSRCFADNFEPYRRVISCDSDLLAHDHPSMSSLASVSRVLCARSVPCPVGCVRASVVSGVSAPCVCCGCLLAGSDASRCRVCAEVACGVMADSGSDHIDRNSWKHGTEASGGTKASNMGVLS